MKEKIFVDFLIRIRRLKQGPEHPNVKRMFSQAMWGILHQQYLRKPLLSNLAQKTDSPENKSMI